MRTLAAASTSRGTVLVVGTGGDWTREAAERNSEGAAAARQRCGGELAGRGRRRVWHAGGRDEALVMEVGAVLRWPALQQQKKKEAR